MLIPERKKAKVRTKNKVLTKEYKIDDNLKNINLILEVLNNDKINDEILE